ncbi:MAG: hypothetical protein Q9181_003869 [Wetmoreana brouardii]
MAPASAPSGHPPTVEAAYKKKCIQLRKRMIELEEANNAAHLRKVRNERFIRKMRLERAILLEKLDKILKKNGDSIEGLSAPNDEDSEGSSEGPPTPHNKPLRSKRSHRRPTHPSPPPPAALAPASSSFQSTATPRHHHLIDQPHRIPIESILPAHNAIHEYNSYAQQPNGHGAHHLDSPLDAFNTWVPHFLAANPELLGQSVANQMNRAREAWERLPEREVRAMQEDYQNRYAEHRAAVMAAEEQAMQQGGEHEGNGDGEEGDEELEAVAGGFTAVNG